MLIKKEKRLHLKLKKKKHDKLIYGTVGIQALQTGEITREQLETIRRFLMRNFNKQCLYWFRMTFRRNIFKRSTGIRMGRGKGPIYKTVAAVFLGQVFLELEFATTKLNFSVLNSIIKKLPIRSKIIKNQ